MSQPSVHPPVLSGEDGHSSEFPLSWLLGRHVTDRAEAYRARFSPRLWDAASFPWEEADVAAGEYMETEDGLRKALRSIFVNGFTVVREFFFF